MLKAVSTKWRWSRQHRWGASQHPLFAAGYPYDFTNLMWCAHVSRLACYPRLSCTLQCFWYSTRPLTRTLDGSRCLGPASFQDAPKSKPGDRGEQRGYRSKIHQFCTHKRPCFCLFGAALFSLLCDCPKLGSGSPSHVKSPSLERAKFQIQQWTV